MRLTDRLSAWAAAGYGSGGLTLTPDGAAALAARLSMAMGVAGLRGEMLAPPGGEVLSLALKGDARFTRTSSGTARDEAGGRLASARADVWLLRTGLEASQRFVLGRAGTGLVLVPRFEIGLRLDGGDAETGFGTDLGGGLTLVDPKRGLTLDLDLHGLAAHAASGFRQWGASAGLAWDARPSTDRGLSMSLRQSWGASPPGGLGALLGRDTLAGLIANRSSAAGTDDNGPFGAAGRVEGEIRYGVAMIGGGFTGTPHAGLELSEGARRYRMGWRLTSARRGDSGFVIELGIATRDAGAGEPVHSVALGGTIRW